MKRLIKSIKKNPNAGRTEYSHPGITTNFKTLNDGQHVFISDEELNGIAKYYKEHHKYPEGIKSIESSRDINTVHSIFPESDYFIMYKPLKVKCYDCGTKFDFSKLKSDECTYLKCGGEYYSEKVCPKCGVFDCLNEQVINETVEEFKRRTGIK